MTDSSRAVANLGAISLENARLYEACRKDYDTLRQDVLRWRATLEGDRIEGGLWSLFRKE